MRPPASAAIYRAIVEVSQLDTVETPALFRASAATRRSPVDTFIANTATINRIYLRFGPDGVVDMPELASVAMLGYMSAVESYVRAILTGLINIDEHARVKVATKTVSFALATERRDHTLLPEALFENESFTTKGRIENAWREYVGLDKLPNDLAAVLKEYEKLCQVRHCCVHRFGKLGSQNAMALGFASHRDLIEKPFAPTLDDLERIADILLTLVRTLNNALFREVLDRTVKAGLEGKLSWAWTWTYVRDRKRFTAYYDLFASTLQAPVSAQKSQLYADFRSSHAAMVAGFRRTAGTGREASAQAARGT